MLGQQTGDRVVARPKLRTVKVDYIQIIKFVYLKNLKKQAQVAHCEGELSLQIPPFTEFCLASLKLLLNEPLDHMSCQAEKLFCGV